MADYSSLSQNELINLLYNKDNELTAKDNEIQSIENQLTTLQQSISTDDNGTTISFHTASSIIQGIIELSDQEQKNLPALVRTSEDGVKAYSLFLYGAATGIETQTTATTD